MLRVDDCEIFDAFYTPPDLAELMVAAAPVGLAPKIIADFAAGEGILLTKAKEIWPDAKIVANDMASSSARNLKRINPSWTISCADFLSKGSSASAFFNREVGNIDLILINPPFSERGRRPVRWSENGASFYSGTAIRFLFNSLRYLKSTGCLIALMPNSCLKSDRDKLAWNVIKKQFDVEIIAANKNNVFAGVTASTSLLRIKYKKVIKNLSLNVPDKKIDWHVKVYRGSQQMHAIDSDMKGVKFPLIHTTELKNGEVSLISSTKIAGKNIFHGPGVLFPRVGRVTPGKICILSGTQSVILSDCVLAISNSSLGEAEEIRRAIFNNWEIFVQAYCSTGAPYITVASANEVVSNCLRKSLSDNGFFGEESLMQTVVPLETV